MSRFEGGLDSLQISPVLREPRDWEDWRVDMKRHLTKLSLDHVLAIREDRLSRERVKTDLMRDICFASVILRRSVSRSLEVDVLRGEDWPQAIWTRLWDWFNEYTSRNNNPGDPALAADRVQPLEAIRSIRFGHGENLGNYANRFNALRNKLLRFGSELSNEDFLTFYLDGVVGSPQEHEDWVREARRSLRFDQALTLHEVQLKSGALPQNLPKGASPRAKPSNKNTPKRIPSDTVGRSIKVPFDSRKPGTCNHRGHRPEDCFVDHPEQYRPKGWKRFSRGGTPEGDDDRKDASSGRFSPPMDFRIRGLADPQPRRGSDDQDMRDVKLAKQSPPMSPPPQEVEREDSPSRQLESKRQDPGRRDSQDSLRVQRKGHEYQKDQKSEVVAASLREDISVKSEQPPRGEGSVDLRPTDDRQEPDLGTITTKRPESGAPPLEHRSATAAMEEAKAKFQAIKFLEELRVDPSILAGTGLVSLAAPAAPAVSIAPAVPAGPAIPAPEPPMAAPFPHPQAANGPASILAGTGIASHAVPAVPEPPKTVIVVDLPKAANTPASNLSEATTSLPPATSTSLATGGLPRMSESPAEKTTKPGPPGQPGPPKLPDLSASTLASPAPPRLSQLPDRPRVGTTSTAAPELTKAPAPVPSSEPSPRSSVSLEFGRRVSVTTPSVRAPMAPVAPMAPMAPLAPMEVTAQTQHTPSVPPRIPPTNQTAPPAASRSISQSPQISSVTRRSPSYDPESMFVADYPSAAAAPKRKVPDGENVPPAAPAPPKKRFCFADMKKAYRRQ